MEKKKKKGWRVVLIVILALILAIVLAVFFVVKSYLNQIGRTEDAAIPTIAPEDEFFEVDVTPEPSPTLSGSDDPVEPTRDPNVLDIDPDDVEWPFIEALEDDKLINILLVGQDKMPDEAYQGRMHSDTMILCSINPETGEVAMVSFLRDLYVQIPGEYSDNRLNAPYVFGGFELLDETLKTNFGISVDANFEVDMSGFIAIIDMVGGIDIELSKAEMRYLNKLYEQEVVTEGMNHMDGSLARHFAQIRAIDSDFNRTGRQREILLTVLEKVRNLPVNELLALMYDALPYVTTDLTDGQILSLAYRLLPLVKSIQVETYYVPEMDCFTLAYVRGMQVLIPDRELIRTRLEGYLPLS